MGKSYWIWYYGDYELHHLANLHFRRTERNYTRPACWPVSTPYVNVKFWKEFTCGEEGGYLVCRINGLGDMTVDGTIYASGERVTLGAGRHVAEAHVANYGGLPAIFVESDVCPSDESWGVNHFAGPLEPAGWDPQFDAPEKNPEVFPFAYETKYPVASERVEDGILFDFGTELFGYLDITGADGKDMGVFYGESREEALDTDYTVVIDKVSGETSYRLTQRAFRFIHLTPAPEGVAVTAEYEYLPLAMQGTFACDRPLFEKIREVSAYTFHLNCREGFLDGIKRDRWVWSGDAYQSARINRYSFFDKAIEQRTFLGLVGKEPINQHPNTILDYSFLWILALSEHYMTYADGAFIRRIFPLAKSLLAFCESRINADGFVEGKDGDWTFIDWSEIEKVGPVAAEQMLLIAAYKAMAVLAEAQGLDGSDYLRKSEDLHRRVDQYYWKEELGAYIDSYTTDSNHVTRHANIFAILYDIADAHQTGLILQKVLKNDKITKITTPYFEGYELDALAKLGELSAVEDMLESYWGGMIALGATTVWEEYDPTLSGADHYAMYGGKYHKSLCHAWGAGPIYLYGRYYLGVYATSPGYETFRVEPCLGGLAEISGTVPVNGGSVEVKLDRTSLRVKTDKAGGTLVWNGIEYPLVPGEEMILKG